MSNKIESQIQLGSPQGLSLFLLHEGRHRQRALVQRTQLQASPSSNQPRGGSARMGR